MRQRDPRKLAGWAEAPDERARTGTMQEAAAFGEVVALAVKGTAAIALHALVHPGLHAEPLTARVQAARAASRL